MRTISLTLGWLLALSTPLEALTIKLLKKDAVVWSQDQLIRGVVDTLTAPTGILYLNGLATSFQLASGGGFSAPVRLREGVNTIVGRVDSAGQPRFSDTLRLTLGFKLRPSVLATASVLGRTVTLRASVLENPDSARLSFRWSQDPGNPALVAFSNPMDSVTSFTTAAGAPAGEYYYNLLVTTADGDSANARTLVTIDSTGIKPFSPKTDCARWIEGSIIYGISPFQFVYQGRFADITNKIPEIAQLGVSAIWLMPTYETHGGGHGYDVVDYFGIRRAFGTAVDLRALVQTAHFHGLKVLLDFVPNHTSIYHPYAQQSTQQGTESHYYDFYQRVTDNAPYSQHYHFYQGFINYFWNELPNLNYNNPEVQRMIIEAGKYWIEKFDIDGYRIDVAWGVNARKPEFMKQWRIALKSLKPEILLLGEDKATWSSVFDERFDAAYDWAAEESWVSHWMWQTTYSTSSNPTIFNSSSQPGVLLRQRLTNWGNGYPARARVLRFMENNDTFRFLPTHDLARTKMVAAMMFSIPGLPLVFSGQEVGVTDHPYSGRPIFRFDQSIRSQDVHGLFTFYQRLSLLRKKVLAFTGKNFQEIPLSKTSYIEANCFSFRRWQEQQNVFVLMNLGRDSVTAQLQIPVDQLGLDSTRTYYLTDLLTNGVRSVRWQELRSISISISSYTTTLLHLGDTPFILSGAESIAGGVVPTRFDLAQNYPNPFNPLTRITFELPMKHAVRMRVFDLLGRDVATLVDEERDAGTHIVQFNAEGLPSGVYLYRFESGGYSATKKAVLLR